MVSFDAFLCCSICRVNPPPPIDGLTRVRGGIWGCGGGRGLGQRRGSSLRAKLLCEGLRVSWHEPVGSVRNVSLVALRGWPFRAVLPSCFVRLHSAATRQPSLWCSWTLTLSFVREIGLESNLGAMARSSVYPMMLLVLWLNFEVQWSFICCLLGGSPLPASTYAFAVTRVNRRES